MTKKQLIKIVKIIRSDANCTSQLHEGGNRFCVIGGLLFAAGVPKKRLIHRATPDYDQLDILNKLYGLSAMQVDVLMSVNDSHESTNQRRKALVAASRGLTEKADELEAEEEE